MSLIEISSDADGASFHSASSGSVEVLATSPAASPAAMRPPPPRPLPPAPAPAPAAANVEPTSARRSTRVRVPAAVRSPPPPPPPRAARRPRAAAAADPGGENLPTTRVKRQAVEEGRRAGGDDAGDDGRATGAGPSHRGGEGGGAPDIRDDVDDLENLAAQIDRYNLEAAHALSKLPPRQRPSALEMDRMVRAVMRLLLFRAGRSAGAPVRSDQVTAAVRGASMSGATSSSAATAAGAGGGGGRASAAAAAAAAAAASAAAAAPSWPRVAAVVKEAQARFARELAMEMAQIDLLPASAVGRARAAAAAPAGGAEEASNTSRRGGASGATAGPSSLSSANTTRAYVLRSLLPPRLLATSRSGGSRGGGADPNANPRRLAPAVALVAAALVRLDRGGAGTPASDLWAVLGELGLPKPRPQTASSSSSAVPINVPGIGDPADAVAAALRARLLVEKRGGGGGSGSSSRDAEGQPQTVYALGEAALGPDGRCSAIDEFITAMFESADPAQAIEAL